MAELGVLGFRNINPLLFFLTDFNPLFNMIMFCSDLLSESCFDRFSLVLNPVIVVFLYNLKLLA